MNVKRITRLLKLLQTLQSGSGQNADGLARACGVSRRTIFRDLESLRLAGVPLEYDPDGQRYSIPSSFFLPPMNLTAAEALSLIALAGEMGRGDRLPFYEAAHSAVLKLESSLPVALRDEMRTLARAIKIRPSQVSRLDSKASIYQQLVDAIAARRVVRILYDSFTEWEIITTKLRPYQLLFCRHSWYVIGRSSMHGEVRTFNLSRVMNLEVLDQRYTMPRGFSLERYMGNAWNLIPERGRDFDVVVRFKSLVARNVAEVVWHKTQQMEFLEDGSLDYRVRVSGLNEIVWWILGYGDQAEVLQPAKLRRLVAQRARNMTTMYNGNGMTNDK
jgi:predicted DNA-binding transcriptional regulator YafY